MLYIPEAFKEEDLGALHALMEAHGFATLISPDAQDPMITHLPLLLDRGRGELGTLIGHVARGNPHWRRLQERPAALAIFHGPHTYVSPALYAHHPSVPTWNYAVVHAHGSASLIEDPAVVESSMRRMVEQYESGRANRWHMQLPRDYADKMLGGVTGFELRITRLAGKFKLSQNRPPGDMQRVTEALEQGSPADHEVARLMRARRL
jgi:transcriptional regulator